MGICRLGLAVVAAFLFIALKPEPARASGALALETLHEGASVDAAATSTDTPLLVHFHKSQSFYCYPRNYWWFYRPYLTAEDNHPRCMPYFHYYEPSYNGRAPSNRYIK